MSKPLTAEEEREIARKHRPLGNPHVIHRTLGNPHVIHRIDPDDTSHLLIITEDWDGNHPHGRNSRPTPPIGDRSLTDLVRNMEELTDEASGDYGQLQPSAAVLNPAGVAELYFGFRRARAVQTRNVGRRAAGLPPIPLNVMITDRELTEAEIVARSLAENAFRRDPSPMQIAETVAAYRAQGLNMTDIGRKIGKSQAAVSVFARMNHLPANARRALETGKLDYKKASVLVKMLPKGKASGGVLDAAQARIAARVDKMLNGAPVMSRAKGRPARQLLAEIEAAMQGTDSRAAEVRRLLAVRRFIEGGAVKTLLRALA